MQPFSQSQQEFLGRLLEVIIRKMKYDDETDWGNEEDEPEEEALFVELRKVKKKILRQFAENRNIMRR